MRRGAGAAAPTSPAQMREFASRFTREEWEALCSDRRFMDRFAEADLGGPFRFDAERILHESGARAMGGA